MSYKSMALLSFSPLGSLAVKALTSNLNGAITSEFHAHTHTHADTHTCTVTGPSRSAFRPKHTHTHTDTQILENT